MNIRRNLLLSGVFAALATYGLAADARLNPPGCKNDTPQDKNPNCVDPASADILSSPEIDGASAITAGAMLAGILALVGERRRRKDQ